MSEVLHRVEKKKLNKTTFISSFNIVFSHYVYWIISITTAVFFWIVFNMAGELLFFTPIWIFYLPEDAYFSFILTNITSALLGMVVSMNIYILKHSSFKISKSLFSGTSLGLIASTCASCSSIGFALVSTLGSIGIVISNFFSVYEIPLRLLSIGILIYAIYSSHIGIDKSCLINFKPNKN